MRILDSLQSAYFRLSPLDEHVGRASAESGGGRPKDVWVRSELAGQQGPLFQLGEAPLWDREANASQ